MVNKSLQIEYVDINSIKPYKRNAKTHPIEQIRQIEDSIRQFGMDDPIAIWHGEVVEGHGRLIACKNLGYKEVPVIRLDNLTDEQRRAYGLVHNKLTMNSPFDMTTLVEELSDIINIDMEDFGFNADDLDIDVGIENDFEDEEGDYTGGEFTKVITCPSCNARITLNGKFEIID